MDNINITSAQHQADPMSDTTSGIKATIDGQELFVPLDPANRHYAEILKLVAAGALTIQDAE